MCNVMVSYFKINQKFQRRERQRKSEQADPSRSEQSDQSMSGAIIVEHIRDEESISEQTELRGMIRLEQSGVKASDEKTCQIVAEQEQHREREEPFQNRKEKCSEKIRSQSEKNIVEQIRASSVVQNDVEQGEDTTGEGRQTTAAKYTEQWKIIQ